MLVASQSQHGGLDGRFDESQVDRISPPRPSCLRNFKRTCKHWKVSRYRELRLKPGIYQCELVQERIAADILSQGRIQVGTLSLYKTERDIIVETRKVCTVTSCLIADLRYSLYSRPNSR